MRGDLVACFMKIKTRGESSGRGDIVCCCMLLGGRSGNLDGWYGVLQARDI